MSQAPDTEKVLIQATPYVKHRRDIEIKKGEKRKNVRVFDSGKIFLLKKGQVVAVRKNMKEFQNLSV